MTTTTKHTAITITKDFIVSRLREDKIKLWLPPYHYNDAANKNKNDSDCDAALQVLARKLCKEAVGATEMTAAAKQIHSMFTRIS